MEATCTSSACCPYQALEDSSEGNPATPPHIIYSSTRSGDKILALNGDTFEFKLRRVPPYSNVSSSSSTNNASRETEPTSDDVEKGLKRKMRGFVEASNQPLTINRMLYWLYMTVAGSILLIVNLCLIQYLLNGQDVSSSLAYVLSIRNEFLQLSLFLSMLCGVVMYTADVVLR